MNPISRPNQSEAGFHRLAGAPAMMVCALVAAGCYLNTMQNGFCEDDNRIIVRNPLVCDPGQWRTLWLTDYWHQLETAMPHRDLLYRPVAILSYRLNYLVGGLHPSGYHAVNVALHVLVVLLVYRLSADITASASCAFVSGLIFAALPIHTEAVNSVVGRAELLATSFTLLALCCVKPPRRVEGSARRRGRLGALAVCTFGALGSKESGAAVLLLVPFFAWYWRTLPSAPGGCGRSERRPWFSPAALVTVMSLAGGAYLALRFAALDGRLYQPVTVSKTVNVLAEATVWERVCGAMQLWGMYWAKTVWPRVLVVDYSINAVALADRLTHPDVLLGVVLTLGLCLLAGVSLRRGDRAPALLAVATVISYLPVSNALILIKTFFAERLWYPASVWVVMLFGWSVCVGAPRVLSARLAAKRVYAGLAAGIVVLLVGAGGARCWWRNTEWRDNGTLYAAAYRDHPDAIRALYGYGCWLVGAGRQEEGLALLSRSVLIDIGFTEGHRALGEVLLGAGRPEKALTHLTMADAQVPGHPATVALLQWARGMASAASQADLASLEQHVAIRTDDLEALLILADRLAEAGRAAEAADRLAAAEPRFGQDIRFVHRLAVAQVMSGRQEHGIAAYRRAVRLDPSRALIAVELAMLLLDRRAEGDYPEAKVLVERAARLAPQRVPVRIARAEILALEGRRDEAARIYRELAESLTEDGELRQRCLLRAAFLEK